MNLYNLFYYNENGEKVYVAKNLTVNETIDWLNSSCVNWTDHGNANGVKVYHELA